MNELTITQDHIVSLHILLSDQHGNTLADNREGPAQVYRHGAGMILPRLEKFLEGMRAEQEAEFVIRCEDAFGPHEPGLLLFIPREDLEEFEAIEMGDLIRIFDGTEGVVMSKTAQGIEMDANHPLSGKDLHYHVRVLDVRIATEADEETAAADPDPAVCSPGCAC